ncbi:MULTISPECIES: ABC transporter substrate-binding protein [Psychrilyobacter]|uniref:Myristoyl transferase n=1 Tax=Psychrilyobacter piezotolerans TaxID=2293438 RepID=A0ABX9KED9_9FUSO|nr:MULTISPECIES: ABC transporter substrate-binding protein [Psychrilyobacter]MCS5421697.1 ABC transporter substrate-binding protein [Psychrilyobacter sp. S5]NDI78862.1 ABC transporter substrate-binding protein [Psychrilyobacter piezotolerans]RDE59369.1 myristoyl transferase [Psychrilyobacter sp. S5]REI39872.1 myristoyl transferase [Psychrilyobacter piezotolerans]
MKNKKLYLILGVLFLSLISCRKYEEPIKIGVNDWPPCELWYIAEKQGYFEDTKVEIIRFSTWADNLTAFYLGKTDIVSSSYFNTLYYDKKGEDAKMILTADIIKGADGLVVKNYIENLKDLKGKKIAVELGTDEHFLLHKALEKIGLKEEEVTIIPATSKEGMEKFILGEVDACLTYEPFMTRAAQKGGGRVTLTTTDLPDYVIDVLLARNEVLEKRKKDYSNLIRAWYKAQKFVDENPEEAYKIMSSKENMSSEEFKLFYESFKMYSIDENKEIFASEKFKEKLMEMDNFLFENDLISERVEVEKIYTDEIIIDIGEEKNE